MSIFPHIPKNIFRVSKDFSVFLLMSKNFKLFLGWPKVTECALKKNLHKEQFWAKVSK